MDPLSYWANSSGNDIVYDYIGQGDETLKEKFRRLVDGKSVAKHIHEKLTYREMNDIDNIYSILLFTGYLKPVRKLNYDIYELMIPNKEVKIIYKDQFEKWTKEYVEQWQPAFSDALIAMKVKDAEDILNYMLECILSYHDANENFYHGLLTGFLARKDMKLISNRE